MAFKIRSARYGIGAKPGEFVDVTEAVRKQATKSGVRVIVTNDALGVGRVVPGKRKRLWLTYALDGVEGQADATERRTLKVPA